MFHIDVWDNISDKGLIDFFKGWRWRTDLISPVTLSFETCNFIAPYGVTMFAAYVLWLREAKRCHVSVKVSPNTVAGNYLFESGLMEMLGIPTANMPDARPDRIVKLTRIREHSEVPPFIASVMSILQIEDEELEGAVQYSLTELLRNTVQHSDSRCGGIAMAQYYPTTGLVEVCVADLGLGIMSTISEAYPEINTDLKALKLATLPHVSCTFKPGGYMQMNDNAGLGLFFIKQIASLSGGSFFLGSKRALVDIFGDAKGVQQKKQAQAKEGWPGTFAYLQLRRNTISEFESVLSTCRRLAAEARKYPADLALDFIQGIPDLGDEQDELEVVTVKKFEEDVEAAAQIRDEVILPKIAGGHMVVIDFAGVRFATQSFVHALMYKVIRDGQQLGSALSIANCSPSTREAVMAVAAYAKVGES